ncbi:MAG: hemin uptake protein HemP [Thiobacillus sp.]|nr:hemin uptake protein HemP [Thiobacillus sp.]
MNDKPPAPVPQPQDPPALPRFRSEDLFAGGKVVVIVHAEREYLLRLTASNKLILTA